MNIKQESTKIIAQLQILVKMLDRLSPEDDNYAESLALKELMDREVEVLKEASEIAIILSNNEDPGMDRVLQSMEDTMELMKAKERFHEECK